MSNSSLMETIYNLKTSDPIVILQALKKHKVFSKNKEESALNIIKQSFKIFNDSTDSMNKSLSYEILRTLCYLINEDTLHEFNSGDCLYLMQCIISINTNNIRDGAFHRSSTMLLLLDYSPSLRADEILNLMHSLMEPVTKEKAFSPPAEILNELLIILIDKDKKIKPSLGLLNSVIWNMIELSRKTKFKVFKDKNVLDLLRKITSFDLNIFTPQKVSLPFALMGELMLRGSLSDIPDEIVNGLVKKLFKRHQYSQALYLNNSLENNFDTNLIRQLNNNKRMRSNFSDDLATAWENIFFGLSHYANLNHWNIDQEFFQACLEEAYLAPHECNIKNIRSLFQSLGKLSKEKNIGFNLLNNSVEKFTTRLCDLLDSKNDNTPNVICDYTSSLGHLAQSGHLKELQAEPIKRLFIKFYESDYLSKEVHAFLNSLRILAENDVLEGKLEIEAYRMETLVKKVYEDSTANDIQRCKLLKSVGILSTFSPDLSASNRIVRKFIESVLKPNQPRKAVANPRDFLMGAGLLEFPIEKNSKYEELIERNKLQRQIEPFIIKECLLSYTNSYKFGLLQFEQQGFCNGFYSDLRILIGPHVFLHNFRNMDHRATLDNGELLTRKETAYAKMFARKFKIPIAYSNKSDIYTPHHKHMCHGLTQAGSLVVSEQARKRRPADENPLAEEQPTINREVQEAKDRGVCHFSAQEFFKKRKYDVKLKRQLQQERLPNEAANQVTKITKLNNNSTPFDISSTELAENQPIINKEVQKVKKRGVRLSMHEFFTKRKYNKKLWQELQGVPNEVVNEIIAASRTKKLNKNSVPFENNSTDPEIKGAEPEKRCHLSPSNP